MKRVSKRVIRILSAIMTVLLLISSLNFPSYAKEEEDDLGVTYQVGDFVQFGKYEQDGDSSNGKEDIEWQILKVESDRVLVISRYALDCKEYNTSFSDVTWETCSLHSWLNNEFLNTAFSKKEKELIPQVIIENNNNPYNGTSGGGNTNDWIFCLSFQEMKTYFGSYNWYDSEHHHGYNQNLICTPTQYAVNNGAQYNEITEESYNNVFKNYGYTSDVIGLRACDWWLRSPGYASNNACPVIGFGLAGDTSYNVIASFVAVRPALYINTSESTLVINPKSITLDSTSAVLNEGDSMKLVATIQPLLAANKTITWTSSNPSVATVSTDKFNYAATVKATGVGTTKITAKTVNNLTATCEVTVKGGASSDLFADIKVDTWQYKAAKAIYEKGYMTGTGKDGDKIIFSPNTDMNRTMFVQALYSMDGKPEVSYVQKFSDERKVPGMQKPLHGLQIVAWLREIRMVHSELTGKLPVNRWH